MNEEDPESKMKAQECSQHYDAPDVSFCWSQRYSSLKMLTDSERHTNTDRDTTRVPSYKLTLWAFGSGEPIKPRKDRLRNASLVCHWQFMIRCIMVNLPIYSFPKEIGMKRGAGLQMPINDTIVWECTGITPTGTVRHMRGCRKFP